jgi:hypothetical protein
MYSYRLQINWEFKKKNCLLTVIRQPSLYKLLTFHNPNLIHILSLGLFIQRICPGSRLSRNCCNRFFYGEGLLSPLPTPKLEDHPCHLSATAYSIYLQPPSIAGDRSSIRNMKTPQAVVTGSHLTWNNNNNNNNNNNMIVSDCCSCNQPFWCCEDTSADRARWEGDLFR